MNEEKFQSSLAPYIIEFIKYQQKIGRVYKHGEIMLHKFDVFCIDVKFSENVLTKVLVEKWCDYNKSLRVRAQSQHLTYVRQLGAYLSENGIKTYVPPKKYYSGTTDPILLSSPLASYIEDFLAQKKADGYSYESGSRVLHRFDRFCMDQSLKRPVLNRNLVMDWLEVTTASNATYIRQFALYLVSLGMDAYVAGSGRSKSSYVPHVFTTEELTAFFEQVDHFSPGYRSKPRMAMAYSVMFRLYYCCGLRLSEVCHLHASDIDLKTGSITITASKGYKDRIIYMSSDLLTMCQKYDVCLQKELPYRKWFFPASEPEKTICKTNMTRRFHYFWNKTPYAGKTDKIPNVHALRHTFVVHRINKWMQEGLDFQKMIPYLSRYLGHNSMVETHYYYHLAASAFDIIRNHATAKNLIPEVHIDEK